MKTVELSAQVTRSKPAFLRDGWWLATYLAIICGVALVVVHAFPPAYALDATPSKPVIGSPTRVSLGKEALLEAQLSKRFGAAAKSELIPSLAEKDLTDARERLAKLEDRERTLYAAMLEGQRKMVDWWLSFLAVIVALIALSGAILPFLMGRRDREDIQQAKLKLDEAMLHFDAKKFEVEQLVKKFQATSAEYADALETVREFKSNTVELQGSANGRDQASTVVAAKAVRDNDTANFEDRLRARAVLASQGSDIARAVALWSELTDVAPTDASAWFNLAYSLQKNAEAATSASQKRAQLREAGEKYAEALRIKPNLHQAANNWGNALVAEAHTFSTSDLDVARALWNEAGNKYAQALRIEPDSAEAANNWGNALATQANALSSGDLPTARIYWRDAGKKFADALRIKPDLFGPAYNWGNALSAEARALLSSDLTAARACWSEAGKRYADLLRIEPRSAEATNNWGTSLADEAGALFSSDPDAARGLWREAYRKFADVLHINPDSAKAFANWGTALADEASALSGSDLPAAHICWGEADKKFAEALRIKPDQAEVNMNWGAALAEEAKAFANSDVPSAVARWHAAGEKYANALRIKPDMYDAANNWGAALAEEAKEMSRTDLPVARPRWRMAGEKYADALRIKPDMHEAADNWSNALMAQYKCELLVDAEHARTFLEQAKALLIGRAGVDGGSGAYNLACAFALKGDIERALQSLQVSRAAAKLPDKKHIEEDSDFNLIREHLDFKKWLEIAFPPK